MQTYQNQIPRKFEAEISGLTPELRQYIEERTADAAMFRQTFDFGFIPPYAIVSLLGQAWICLLNEESVRSSYGEQNRDLIRLLSNNLNDGIKYLAQQEE